MREKTWGGTAVWRGSLLSPDLPEVLEVGCQRRWSPRDGDVAVGQVGGVGLWYMKDTVWLS